MKQFIVLCVFCLFSTALADSPVVSVKEGKLIGTTYKLPNGHILDAFLGVPYAEPPISKNRFKEPQPLKPWIGTWNASHTSSTCFQVHHSSLYKISGNEDCLYLNIFTPKFQKNITKLMDVVVYFHGGAFMYGTGGIFYPTYLSQNGDIIYISINYRLGVLGFLSTGDDAAPGNFGLKDQVMALKWIQNNIAQFGGNPKSVTIMGCSAGGASVHYHFLSPMSEGLFQKGISLSGSSLPPWTLPKNNTQKSFHFASLLGCPTENTSEVVECLRRRPAETITKRSKEFMMWRYCPFTPFGPVVEPNTSNAFLSSHPFDLLKRGAIKDLPWLFSLNENEGLYPGADFIDREDLMKELNDDWYKIAPNLLMYKYSVPEEKMDNISSTIKNFYFGNNPVSKQTANETILMLGDRLFFNDIIKASKLHNLATKTDMYCYKLIYRGQHSLTNIFARNSVNYGASHADDLMYLVNSSPTLRTDETDADALMGKFMSSIVVNFMKTGNPNDAINSWKPLAKNQDFQVDCLNIYSSSDYRLENAIHATAIKFWESILPDEYNVDG